MPNGPLNVDRVIGSIESRIDQLEKKYDKLENLITDQLKTIQDGNDKLETKIDDLIQKEKYNQGFLKALIVITGLVGFGITTYIKMLT